MISRSRLTSISLKDVVPGASIDHDNGVHRGMVSLSPKGEKLITFLHTYRTYKLSEKRFAEMQDSGQWIIQSGLIQDLVGGSLGSHLMCIERHNIPQSVMTFDITELLAMEARDGDNIVSVFNSAMKQVEKTGEFDTHGTIIEYTRAKGKWVHRKLRKEYN